MTFLCHTGANQRCKRVIRNMPDATLDPDELALSKLLAQLAEVNADITKLTAEKEALERLIIRIRDGRARVLDVTRRNSLDRILVESKVYEIVSGHKTPVLGRYIFEEIVSILPSMKSSTFRSHLHRMKDKGIIKISDQRGFWTLAD
jgi:DNA-binding transcriptional ArsR family regulator